MQLRLAFVGLATVCSSSVWIACGSPATQPAASGSPMSSSTAGSGIGTAGRAGTPGSTTSPTLGSAGKPAAPPTGSAPIVTRPPANTNPPPSAAAGTGVPPAMARAGAAAPPNTMTAAGSSGMQTPPPPPGTWPAADPAKNGPFATVTEEMVGPGMAYTMFRPKDLNGRHPVITWGNGTGTTPPTYRTLLTLYASHGFIVIASNSMNVAQGTPPPMLDGVTWVLAQDMTAGAALFEHVDRDHIGATGHSQGAFAASSAGVDERIKSIAPIETLGASRGLHGPVLGLCGTMDTTVPCSGNMRSFTSISDQPVMYAELKAADHTNWIFSPSGAHPFWVITNAWFRVHLMGDTALRPMFYGPDCTYCKDDAWVIMRKMMD